MLPFASEGIENPVNPLLSSQKDRTIQPLPGTNSPPRHCSEVSRRGGGGVCDGEMMMQACRGDVLLNHSLPFSQSAHSGLFFSPHHKEDHTHLQH